MGVEGQAQGGGCAIWAEPCSSSGRLAGKAATAGQQTHSLLSRCRGPCPAQLPCQRRTAGRPPAWPGRPAGRGRHVDVEWLGWEGNGWSGHAQGEGQARRHGTVIQQALAPRPSLVRIHAIRRSSLQRSGPCREAQCGRGDDGGVAVRRACHMAAGECAAARAAAAAAPPGLGSSPHPASGSPWRRLQQQRAWRAG